MVLSVLIPTLVYFIASAVVTHFTGEPKKYLPWLFAGMALYVVSWWLPSPLIEGKDTNFSTHFVGGGLFTGFVWYYVRMSLKWEMHWLFEAFSLFVLVSALGVANELFEIVLYEFGAMPHGIADTSWDLFANSLGALMFYGLYVLLPKSKIKNPTSNSRRHDSRD